MPDPLSPYSQSGSIFWDKGGKEERVDKSGVNFFWVSEAAQYSFSADWEIIPSQNMISIYRTI